MHNNNFQYKTRYLNKEQQALGDFSIPHFLQQQDYCKKAHHALIEFLKLEDPTIFNTIKNDKLFSREYKYARQRDAFSHALFFIHHSDERLSKWFSYDRKEENFKKLYNHLRDWGFFVDFFENGVSAVFIGFGVKKYN
jgi:hypothetical protein